MAFETPKLLKKTEEAILTFLKDDIEHTLPLIEKLEEISYQLWTENNTKFLFDDGLGLEDDEEQWFWDEEVFYDHSSRIVPDTPYTPYQEKVTYISDNDSNYSSYVESSVQSTCQSPSSSTGYHGSCESSLSASTLYAESPKNADDWIVISAELSCKEDSDWLLISPKTNEEEQSFACGYVSHSCEKTCDWTVLSVQVNSRKWNTRTSSDKTNSPNSGIRRQLFRSPKYEPSRSSSPGSNGSYRDSIGEGATPTCSTTGIRTEERQADHQVFRTEEDDKEDCIIVTADSPARSSSD